MAWPPRASTTRIAASAGTHGLSRIVNPWAGDDMSLVGGAGAAGWWLWTISPDGVSWSCSNCVTIFTRTT